MQDFYYRSMYRDRLKAHSLQVTFVEGARFLYHTVGVKSCEDVHDLLVEAWLFEIEKAQMEKLFSRPELRLSVKEDETLEFRESEKLFHDNITRAQRQIGLMFRNAERLKDDVSRHVYKSWPPSRSDGIEHITGIQFRASAGERIWPILRAKDRAARLAPARRILDT